MMMMIHKINCYLRMQDLNSLIYIFDQFDKITLITICHLYHKTLKKGFLFRLIITTASFPCSYYDVSVLKSLHKTCKISRKIEKLKI